MSEATDLERQLRRMRVLAQASQAFAAEIDEGKLAAIITRTCADVIGDFCGLTLRREDDPDLLVMASVHHSDVMLGDAYRKLASMHEIRIGEGFAGRIVATNQADLHAEIAPAAVVAGAPAPFRDAARLLNVHSWVGVPMRTHGTAIGAISMARSRAGVSYTGDDVAFLQDLADRAALAVENARLYSHLERRVARATSDLAATNRELVIARDAATAAAATKSAFLASMSHEIRTPMNAIIGMTSVLLGSITDGEQRETLEIIRTSGQHLLSVINDILDYSKFEAGRVELENEPFDVRACVDDVIDLVAHTARGKGIGLRAELAPDLVQWVRGDVGRLRQVLLNLVGNAVKFTSTGEVVVTVAAGARRDELAFTVRDTGPGILPEQAARLFQPFTQGDASTTRKFGGTGLGLAIAKRLVEAMGGVLAIDPGVAVGATFRFAIRAVSATPRTRTIERLALGATPPALPALRVLVAEDNAINQRVAIALLARLGQRADVVANGREAVAALHARDYDIVLMDGQMPELDGYAASQEIRGSLAPDRQPWIIALTANAMEGDRERCLAAGMNDYVAKPVQLEMLVQALVRAVEERGLAQRG